MFTGVGASGGRSFTTWPFTASEVGAGDGEMMLVLVGGVAVWGRSFTTWPFTAPEVGASDGELMLVLVGGVAVWCCFTLFFFDDGYRVADREDPVLALVRHHLVTVAVVLIVWREVFKPVACWSQNRWS